VQSDESDPRLIEWTIGLLGEVGMKPVHVKADIPGFIGNRLQHALKREAIALLAGGACDAETIDTVVKYGFGPRLGVLGPLEQSDLSGLTLTLQIHDVLIASLDRTPGPHPLLVEKVHRGELGASTGQGFRSWSPGEAATLRDRVSAELVELARRRARVDTRPESRYS
jgi:3-hydroxybutyryl-CoA dehydrogenase